jgi:hypothetical protein
VIAADDPYRKRCEQEAPSGSTVSLEEGEAVFAGALGEGGASSKTVAKAGQLPDGFQGWRLATRPLKTAGVRPPPCASVLTHPPVCSRWQRHSSTRPGRLTTARLRVTVVGSSASL